MVSDPDALLSGLDDQQRHAVTTDALPLCIVAGAGTGKTRVLTRRIAWRCATEREDARRVLALTFTRAAARQLTNRLRALGLNGEVRAGTFHGVAWRELRRDWPTPPALLQNPSRLLRRLLDDEEAVGATATEIAWARARLVAPDEYVAAVATYRRTPAIAPDTIAATYAEYEELKRARGLVDFDDLLAQLTRAIERDAEVAAGQRWSFSHLYVDEFQDLNPLQFRLLQAWRGGRPDLTVVGDPNQAIYGWNGADASYITEFTDIVGGTRVEVANSYRSSPQILAVANSLLDAGVRLRAVREEGPAPTIDAFETGEDEVAAVVRALRDSVTPARPWTHHAVLTRTNAQLIPFAEGLAAAGIPYRRRGRRRLANSDATRTLLADLAAPGASFHEVAARLDEGDDDGAELLALADEFEREGPKPTAFGFRGWLLAALDEDGDPADEVTLATFHGAKGLEWPYVHVCGVEQGYVPIGYATTSEALREERRLLYVACTRAEQELRLSWAKARTMGGQVVRRRPSPFLADVRPVLDVIEARNRVADWRDHLPAVRSLLDDAVEG